MNNRADSRADCEAGGRNDAPDDSRADVKTEVKTDVRADSKADVLIVEDDAGVTRIVRIVLEKAGFSVREAAALREARAELKASPPDVVLLDIMLPDGDGRRLIPDIRASGDALIMMLTSKREYQDILGSLTGGADDYMAKPFMNDELTARIDALLMKRAARAGSGILRLGALLLDADAGRASVAGKDLVLTPKDFALLKMLAQNEGRAIQPDQLYERLWKQTMSGDSQAVRSAISRLRGKITGSGYTIVFVPGEGYRLTKEE